MPRAARFWLQVRPRGSAGWESSLRQKPPVRLIFQAGQAQHEMKIKEVNSVETLRDLPTPLRVRVCVGLGLPRGFPGALATCTSAVPWLVAVSPCLSFPCEMWGVPAVACPCCELGALNTLG